MIRLHIEPLDEGGFLATSDDLLGLIAEARPIAETIEIAPDVARKLVESYIDHGDELPEALRSPSVGDSDIRIPVSVG